MNNPSWRFQQQQIKRSSFLSVPNLWPQSATVTLVWTINSYGWRYEQLRDSGPSFEEDWHNFGRRLGLVAQRKVLCLCGSSAEASSQHLSPDGEVAVAERLSQSSARKEVGVGGIRVGQRQGQVYAFFNRGSVLQRGEQLGYCFYNSNLVVQHFSWLLYSSYFNTPSLFL